MAQQALLILGPEQIDQKLNRLAYQIYEQNFEERRLMVCGIAERGYQLAERIHQKLLSIASMDIELCRLSMDKQNLHAESIHIEPAIQQPEEVAVILCDDVLYTGKTLAYAAMPFLEAGVKKLQCLVLIHRDHLLFPVQPTFTGMSLATTIQEHVKVDFASGNVYLQ